MTRKDETKPHGPGNTFWYVEEDGSIMRCHWNDSGWINHTGRNLNTLQPWEFSLLMQSAYRAGMEDKEKIVKSALGIT